MAECQFQSNTDYCCASSSMFIIRGSPSALCFLLIGVFVAVSTLHVSADDCTEKIDVAIFTPRLVLE